MPRRCFVFDAYGTLYDVQSPARAAEAAFPGMGTLLTQIWRLKQLEYTWLRSLMGEWRDFAVITEESLRFTLRVLGLAVDDAQVRALAAAYERLDPYPDARAALEALAGHGRAILSNGSQPMLDALVRHSGFDPLFDAVLSADACRISKPAAAVYALVERRLGVAPPDVVFVSSNPFDVAGAKRFGFKVAWIERVTGPDLAGRARSGAPDPATFFSLLRNRPEELGQAADWRISSLGELAGLA